MKVLDVTLFREGMQRNVETLMRLEEEMQMIRAATEELLALQESLKGEGGDASGLFTGIAICRSCSTLECLNPSSRLSFSRCIQR